MQELLPKQNKTGKNVALGVAGAFFLVPWFFMDFSDAERVEYNALRNRYNHLASIAMSKHCRDDIQPLPSAEEMQEKAREARNKEEKEFPTSR